LLIRPRDYPRVELKRALAFLANIRLGYKGQTGVNTELGAALGVTKFIII